MGDSTRTAHSRVRAATDDDTGGAGHTVASTPVAVPLRKPT
ncbi:hypothetical protein [Lentzea terrae]|nr:hypothetical protein [Lentzea terrae]